MNDARNSNLAGRSYHAEDAAKERDLVVAVTSDIDPEPLTVIIRFCE